MLVAASASATPAAAALSVSTTAAPTFSATLSGVDQTASYQLPMTVIDSTGTGAGWHLTVTSTRFTTAGATPQTLPTTASRVTAVTATCAAGSCTNPTTNVSLPVTIPAADTAPPAARFFNAQPATGLGEFTVTPSIAVDVPTNAYTGTYTSTLTVAIASGP